MRTSSVCAARSHNFIKTVLKLATERDSLKVINERLGAPTGAGLLVDATAQIITRLMLGKGEEGTYHCVAAGENELVQLCAFSDRVGAWERITGQSDI